MPKINIVNLINEARTSLLKLNSKRVNDDIRLMCESSSIYPRLNEKDKAKVQDFITEMENWQPE